MDHPGWLVHSRSMNIGLSRSQSTISGATSIGCLLDGLNWRPVHTRIALALGVGWMLDAFEVNIIGNVLGTLKTLWHVTGAQASLMISVWLIGIMVGALLFGYFADRYGRRKLFVGTLLLYSFFTVVSAASPGFLWFIVFRFLTAIGVGAEYSAVNAAIGELIPARYRGRANALVMTFWPVGAMLAGLLVLYLMRFFPPSVGWRFAFALGAVIAVFTLWIRRTLPESPRWLARKGRWCEARQISCQMTGDESCFDLSKASKTAVTSRHEGFVEQLRLLLRRHPGRLALGCALDFSEASGYYGLFALVPLVVLPRLHISGAGVPYFFIIGNVGALLGGLSAAIALDLLGRKTTVTVCYLTASLSMWAIGNATLHGSPGWVLAAFMLANFCATASWVGAYPTFSEIFPTRLRATGIGFSVAFGRIGAAISPPLLVLVANDVSVTAAFMLIAGFWLVGAVAMMPWAFLGPEGKSRPLEILAPDG